MMFMSVLTVLFLVLQVSYQQKGALKYRVAEEEQVNTEVGNVATDAGLSRRYQESVFERLRYNFLIQPNDETRFFSIENATGIITTQRVIDRDAICPEQLECILFLSVAISPAEYFQVISIQVEIIDKNDHQPSFPVENVIVKISESALIGTKFALPVAVDIDSPSYGIQKYELFPKEQSVFSFTVGKTVDESTELQLQLDAALDREMVAFYDIMVIAFDGGQPAKSGSLGVNITVGDTNDNSPIFNKTSYNVEVPENTEMNSVILRLHASDQDIGLNGKVRYSFNPRSEINHGKTFGIRGTTGEIFLKTNLDYEEKQMYYLTAIAEDSGPDSQPTSSIVVVKIGDVNDNAPKITMNTLTNGNEAQISEGSVDGTFVAHVSVVDKDSGKNGEITCHVVGKDFRLEQLYQSQYKIVTARLFDREIRQQLHLAVNCSDKGHPKLSTIQDLKVVVLDTNDNSPIFSRVEYAVSVEENNKLNAFLLTVKATDNDLGDNAKIIFSIASPDSGQFTVNSYTGAITISSILDREKSAKIDLRVVATDRGIPPLSTTVTVKVVVQDQNDEPPEFKQPTYSFGVFENQPPGSAVGNVVAEDLDDPPYDAVNYVIDSSDVQILSAFRIDSATGYLVTKITLDREETSVYRFQVIATNKVFPPLRSTTDVVVYVADENDNAPIIDFPNSINRTVVTSRKAKPGYVVTRVRAHDVDIGKNGHMTYDQIGGGGDGAFEMDSATGAITTTRKLHEVDQNIFNLTVIARDHGDVAKSSSATLVILISDSIIPENGNRVPSDRQRGVVSEGSSSNSVIDVTTVAAVASVSAVIIVILIVAIVVLKLHGRKKKQPGYTSRTEAQKMLNDGRDDRDASRTSARSVSGSVKTTNSNIAGLNSDNNVCVVTREMELPGREINGEMGGDGGQWIEAGHGSVPRSWPLPLNSPKTQSNCTVRGPTANAAQQGDESTLRRNPRNSTNNRKLRMPDAILTDLTNTRGCMSISAKEIQYLQRREIDSESGSSNADSGRGLSEESETGTAGQNVFHEFGGISMKSRTCDSETAIMSFKGPRTSMSDSSDCECQGHSYDMSATSVISPAHHEASRSGKALPVKRAYSLRCNTPNPSATHCYGSEDHVCFPMQHFHSNRRLKVGISLEKSRRQLPYPKYNTAKHRNLEQKNSIDFKSSSCSLEKQLSHGSSRDVNSCSCCTSLPVGVSADKIYISPDCVTGISARNDDEKQVRTMNSTLSLASVDNSLSTTSGSYVLDSPDETDDTVATSNC